MEITINITEQEEAILTNIAQEKNVTIHALCQMYIGRCTRIHDKFMGLCNDKERHLLSYVFRKNR